MVYSRLNKLGVCVSHKTVIRLIRSLGKNYDEPVMCWKGAIEGRGISTVHEPSGDESSGDKESVSIGFDELSDCLVIPQHYTLMGDNIKMCHQAI